jgi:predicted dehydrogenase
MIRIGVIGAGHLGKIHLKHLQQIPQFSICGFFDIHPETSQHIQKESGLKAFSSAEELIACCDAVDIVTPTVSHFSIAQKALKQSKHLFIEKPLCSTVEEAGQIMKLASEAGVKVQVGHVERFNPAFESAKKYFDSPMFIETHRLAQFNPRGTDVSVILDLMIHDIDIVLSVVRCDVKKISASGVAVVSDSPDICNARIEFQNGAVANITTSRISMKNMRKSRFFQRDAYISVDFLKKKTEIIRLKNIDSEVQDPFAIILDLEKKGKKQIFFDNPEIKETDAIKSELESFAEAIENNSPVSVTAEDGFRAMQVAFQVMEMVSDK